SLSDYCFIRLCAGLTTYNYVRLLLYKALRWSDHLQLNLNLTLNIPSALIVSKMEQRNPQNNRDDPARNLAQKVSLLLCGPSGTDNTPLVPDRRQALGHVLAAMEATAHSYRLTMRMTSRPPNTIVPTV